ncbi:hypothetical protein I547_5258 [Mycobacterium kansasii 824]|nr:hypothetical protein I547_5258 [Mycobacterium kansasii 824]
MLIGNGGNGGLGGPGRPAVTVAPAAPGSATVGTAGKAVPLSRASWAACPDRAATGATPTGSVPAVTAGRAAPA